MLDRFRAALDERLSFEELVELYTYGKSYVATYAELSMPAPDWAAEQVKKLRDALVQRRKDTLEKQLAQAKGKMETLKTAEQKREDAAAEIARLEALLAGQ